MPVATGSEWTTQVCVTGPWAGELRAPVTSPEVISEPKEYLLVKTVPYPSPFSGFLSVTPFARQVVLALQTAVTTIARHLVRYVEPGQVGSACLRCQLTLRSGQVPREQFFTVTAATSATPVAS